MNHRIILLLICLLLSSCVTMSNLEKSKATISESEGIIVLGIKPGYRTGIKLGDIQNDSFVYSPNLPVSANIIPDESGYIVTKLKATTTNQRYAITQLLPSGFTGSRLGPCDGASTVTFNVKGGEVIYLGEIDFGRVRAKPKAQYSSNFDQATNYIKSNYPDLVKHLNKGEITFTNVSNMPCNEGPINVPIYVP